MVKPSILVVDDESGFRSVIVDLLLGEGYLVIGADSSEKALSLMDQCHYDIVFTDIRLPGIDGLTLLKEIKRKNNAVEVVLISGHSNLSYALEAIRHGAYDYLIKPLDTIELVLAVIKRLSDKLSLAADKKRLSEEVQVKNRELEEGHRKIVQSSNDISMLYAAEKELMGGLDLVDVYRRATTCLSRLIRFYPTIMWTYSSHGDMLIPEAQSGEGQGESGKWSIPIGEQTSKPTFNMVAYLEQVLASKTSAKSVCFHPVMGRKQPLGFLSIMGDPPNLFSLREREVLSRFSISVAMAIENSNLYEEVKALSIRDGLTGLYNRRHFETVLGMEGFRSVRYQHPVSLIFIDIDHFKTYNDAQGHLFGDEVLKQVATLFVKRVRVPDIVCRYGGDEFTIVLPDTDTKKAKSVAEDIRIMVSSYPFQNANKLPAGMLTVSIGISDCPTHGKNLSDIVKIADQALYHAKLSGRNRVCCA